jgi:hypothetical protein
MATKTESGVRIAELEAAYVIADMLNQTSRDVNAAHDEGEVCSTPWPVRPWKPEP